MVPEYREVTGRYMDPYNRMLHVKDPKLSFVNGYRFRYGVRQLEELAKRTEMQNIRDEDYIEMLRQYLHVDVFRFCFSPVEVAGVLDHIRNRLLEKINCAERSPEYKNRKERLNLLVIDDEGGSKRYFSWRGRGDVHIVEGEEQPRQLRQFSRSLCDALRQYSGMEPQFNRPDNIRGEVVYEVSSDFKAKWRLLGGMNSAPSQQVLVLVPRQQRGR